MQELTVEVCRFAEKCNNEKCSFRHNETLEQYCFSRKIHLPQTNTTQQCIVSSQVLKSFGLTAPVVEEREERTPPTRQPLENLQLDSFPALESKKKVSNYSSDSWSTPKPKMVTIPETPVKHHERKTNSSSTPIPMYLQTPTPPTPVRKNVDVNVSCSENADPQKFKAFMDALSKLTSGKIDINLVSE